VVIYIYMKTTIPVFEVPCIIENSADSKMDS